MTAPLIIPGVNVAERMHSHVLESPLAAPREGIMLHYDDSSGDDSALAWFRNPACTNGYTWLALDEGRVIELADPVKRTPHAGACLTPNSNSRYYGIAAATNGHVLATPAQLDAIVQLCAALFRWHRWDANTVDRRIVGHDSQAIWTPATTRAAGLSDAEGAKRWNQLGRKVDPTGIRPDRKPIIDVAAMRERVRSEVQCVFR